MYQNIAQLLQLSKSGREPMWCVMLANEMVLTEQTEETIWRQLSERYDVMCRAAERALQTPLSSTGNLIQGVSSLQYSHAQGGASLCGQGINVLMARALSCSETNAAMGKICAAPTAGASGILPAVLISVSEAQHSTHREVLEALLLASGIGAVIVKNATVSGAEGGCQAECGVAAAMAAAASVQLAHGTEEQIAHAVAFALMNCMGLICDPVAGLVQVPCAQRNASQAVNAVLSADLALAGMQSIIPADEVITAMYRVGRMLPPELRETAQGGLAATPTGKEIMRRIYGRE